MTKPDRHPTARHTRITRRAATLLLAFAMGRTGWGVKAWLPDLTRWAEVITHFLRPGGKLHLLEIHPFAHIFAEGEDAPRVANPYFMSGPTRYETFAAASRSPS